MQSMQKKIGFGLGYIIIFILLLYLGHWQYGRYQQKTLIEKQYAHQINNPTLSLTTLIPGMHENISYQPVHFSGQFHNEAQYWLDNQIVNHQVGYRIFSVIHLNTDHSILIDRGWVSRNNLSGNPIPNPTILPQHIWKGLLWRPQGPAFLLKKDHWNTTWPKIIQSIDQYAMQKIEDDLQCSLLPWIVILDINQPGTFLRQVPTPPMTAQKHLGYAIQWYSMAIILTILIFWFYFKKRRRDN